MRRGGIGLGARAGALLALTIGLSAAEGGEPKTPKGPPWAEDCAVLLEGVKEIAGPGVPGTLAVFGEGAFPVVVGKAGGARVPVVAAGRLSRGHVVAFSHDGFLSTGAAGVADTGRLLVNAVSWAAGKAVKHARVSVAGSDLAAYLKAKDVAAEALGGARWTSRLADFDVLCLARNDLSDAEVEDVSRFLASGGGLLAAQTGWGWLQLSPGKELGENALNRLLAPAGLAWTDETVERTSPAGFAAEGPPALLTHGLRAVDALLGLVKGRDLAEPELKQAGVVAMQVVRALPSDDKSIRPRLKALLEERADRLVPTARAPLLLKDALDRFLLAVQIEDLRDVPADHVRPHPAAADFPGAVPPGAKEVERTIRVDTRFPDWQGMGLYAAPGAVVTVTLPESAVGAGLSMRIGCHSDSLWHLDSWPRVPEITREWPLEAARTEVASPFGGLLYVVVSRGSKAGVVDVKISGAVESPLYVLGVTTREEWKTIRKRPAPWAELGTTRVVLALPSEHVRDLEDPEHLMRFWDQVLDADADLAGIPHERARPERYAADVEISAGYMHSGYPIMTHLDAAAAMADLSAMRKGLWGLFHEMGHNHQSADWTFDGTGEVTCNLFSLYVIETVCGRSWVEGHEAMKDREKRIRAHLAAGAKFDAWKADPFLALQTYAQMIEGFGWDAFKRVFAEYRALPDDRRPKTDDEKRDQWLVRFSRSVGKDLGPFFEAWGIPTSPRARTSLRDLPAWMPPGFPP